MLLDLEMQLNLCVGIILSTCWPYWFRGVSEGPSGLPSAQQSCRLLRRKLRFCVSICRLCLPCLALPFQPRASV